MRLYRRLFPPGEDNGIDKSVQESENDKPADEEDFNKSLLAVLSGDYEGPSNTEKTREEVIGWQISLGPPPTDQTINHPNLTYAAF